MSVSLDTAYFLRKQLRQQSQTIDQTKFVHEVILRPVTPSPVNKPVNSTDWDCTPEWVDRFPADQSEFDGLVEVGRVTAFEIIQQHTNIGEMYNRMLYKLDDLPYLYEVAPFELPYKLSEFVNGETYRGFVVDRCSPYKCVFYKN